MFIPLNLTGISLNVETRNSHDRRMMDKTRTPLSELNERNSREKPKSQTQKNEENICRRFE